MKHEMKGGGLSSLPSVEGEVRRVDKGAGKITLRHGEIKQLEMPPMTMVFEVRDKALLDSVKPGDKVNFKVINENGKMIVTELKPAS
jgi:Cu/Ag efflux protein CusF